MLHIQIELFYLLPQIHSCLKERETLDNSIFNNSIFTPLSYQKRRCENIELIHANLGNPRLSTTLTQRVMSPLLGATQ